MSNKHSGRSDIMCLRDKGLFMWISGSRRQKGGCSQAQLRAPRSAAASLPPPPGKTARFSGHCRPRGSSLTQECSSLSGQLKPVTVRQYHAQTREPTVLVITDTHSFSVWHEKSSNNNGNRNTLPRVRLDKLLLFVQSCPVTRIIWKLAS